MFAAAASRLDRRAAEPELAGSLGGREAGFDEFERGLRLAGAYGAFGLTMPVSGWAQFAQPRTGLNT